MKGREGGAMLEATEKVGGITWEWPSSAKECGRRSGAAPVTWPRTWQLFWPAATPAGPVMVLRSGKMVLRLKFCSGLGPVRGGRDTA